MTFYSDGRERPMFPHTIDSTVLATWRACPHKFFLQYVEHWKPRQQSVHLVAGGAFAAGLEAARKSFYIEQQNSDVSIALGMKAMITHYGDFSPPPESAKSLERMLGALEFYFSQYPLERDSVQPIYLGETRGIEFSFAEPLDVLHPVTGQPILYTGRLDMLAEFAGGVHVFDDKTTSSLGASWMNQWDMRSQFTGYQWAAARAGIRTHGTIIRGVSILKTKYDTLQVITHRSPYELERFEYQLNRDIKQMIQSWESGYWDYNLDGGCTEYGGCAFQKVCKNQDEGLILPVYFARKVWDPLARRELTVTEHETNWGHERIIPLVESENPLGNSEEGLEFLL